MNNQTPEKKCLAREAVAALPALLALLHHPVSVFDISTRDKVGELVESLCANVEMEWQELWDALRLCPGFWVRTTQEMADEMLCAVPPRAQSGAGFLVGEEHHDCPETGKPMYACFRKRDDVWSARYITLRAFRGGAL